MKGKSRFAKRLSRLGTETAFEVLARARGLEAQGKSVIHLEIGEPDFDTPGFIREAAKKALDEGWTHYGPSAGLPELRAAIAGHISRTRAAPIRPEEVVITPGAKPILFFAALALIEKDDEVLYPDPGFPIYESMANFLSRRPVPVPLREENGFRLDIADLEERLTRKSRLLILNFPHNPTGSVLTSSELEEIARLCRKYPRLWILSDEIYSGIVYDGSHASFLPAAEAAGLRHRTILLDGFSKTFAMTGWRAGYGVMPEDLAQVVARLMTNSNSCTASFTQRACLAALEGADSAEVRAMAEEFRRRRDVIVEGLNRLPGIRCVEPKGAFYVYPNISGTGLDSRVLARRLLEEAGVACLSGYSFSRKGGSHLRFSYANSAENIREALRRLASWLSENAGRRPAAAVSRR